MKNVTLVVGLMLICSYSFAGMNGRIFNVASRQEIPRTELLTQLSLNDVVVIGEKHYTKEVQDEEAKIISDVVTFSHKENQFSFCWEFLNASTQTQTQTLFLQVLNHEISVEDFLTVTQGTNKAVVYAPLIEATAKLGGKLFGGNLSREEKAPVIQGGLGALDPKLLPPGFQLGGANYLERFSEVMSGHATPEQISNYFAAQSLVDDAIAYHMAMDVDSSLKFLVIGAFHSMYNDGVVERLKERISSAKITSIEIIDCSDYTSEELKKIFIDDKYGDRSDYIVLVNEPVDKIEAEVLWK